MPPQVRASTPPDPGKAGPKRVPPTFLFGLGAAKSGTTWLYEYLRAHPECHVRGFKELHYFDAIEAGRVPYVIERLKDQIARGTARLAAATARDRAKIAADLFDLRDFLHVLQTWHQDKNAYLRYMMTGLGNRKLVADVTPNYALLSPRMLAAMAACAPQTRFLYVVRDPVDRLWSQVRMEARRDLPEGRAFEDHAHEVLARRLSGEDPRGLDDADYARTFAAMEAGVAADRRMVMFYEDLMSVAGLKRLCAFLGIRHVRADFEKVVYKGDEARLTAEEYAKARSLLAPQYAAVAERLGPLPESWRDGAERIAA